MKKIILLLLCLNFIAAMSNQDKEEVKDRETLHYEGLKLRKVDRRREIRRGIGSFCTSFAALFGVCYIYKFVKDYNKLEKATLDDTFCVTLECFVGAALIELCLRKFDKALNHFEKAFQGISITKEKNT